MFNYNDFDDLINKNIKKLKEEYNLSPIKNEIYISGYNGYEIIVDYKGVRYITYEFKKDSSIFILEFRCKTGEFKDIEDLVENIVDSFEVKDYRFIYTPRKEWNKYRLENIEVYYPDNSVIYDNLENWTRQRVKAFNYITNYLGIKWDDKPIRFYVFNSQEHGKEYSLTLGFAMSKKGEIFTLYNASKGHELTHCILAKLNEGNHIDSDLIDEGLATFLDMSGRDFDRLSKNILENNNYEIKMLGNNFRKNKNAYFLGASFVKYLVDAYGLDLFKQFFFQDKYNEYNSFIEFYEKSGEQLINEWMDYLKNY